MNRSLLATIMPLYNESLNGSIDDPSPAYDDVASVARSNTTASSSSGGSSVRWQISYDSDHSQPAPIKQLHATPRSRPPRSSSRTERYQYTYCLIAGAAPLQFVISVEPITGKALPGKYTFRLSLKVDKTERPLDQPISLNLSVDPRQLQFVVFVFPGKSSLPTGCLWSYRVWLRVGGVDHRLWGDDELWVGKDPDFSSISDASYARLKSVGSNTQEYDAMVGGARVQFIAKWQHIGEGLYKYSLEYEASGVGGVLMDDFRLMLQGDPRSVTFLIYTVPMNSIPAGASHRLRVWLKTFLPLPSESGTDAFSLPFNDSYIYQRIFKSDSLKIGSCLDFSTVGSKLIMGYAAGPPKTFTMSNARDLRYDGKGGTTQIG